MHSKMECSLDVLHIATCAWSSLIAGVRLAIWYFGHHLRIWWTATGRVIDGHITILSISTSTMFQWWNQGQTEQHSSIVTKASSCGIGNSFIWIRWRVRELALYFSVEHPTAISLATLTPLLVLRIYCSISRFGCRVFMFCVPNLGLLLQLPSFYFLNTESWCRKRVSFGAPLFLLCIKYYRCLLRGRDSLFSMLCCWCFAILLVAVVRFISVQLHRYGILDLMLIVLFTWNLPDSSWRICCSLFIELAGRRCEKCHWVRNWPDKWFSHFCYRVRFMGVLCSTFTATPCFVTTILFRFRHMRWASDPRRIRLLTRRSRTQVDDGHCRRWDLVQIVAFAYVIPSIGRCSVMN